MIKKLVVLGCGLALFVAGFGVGRKMSPVITKSTPKITQSAEPVYKIIYVEGNEAAIQPVTLGRYLSAIQAFKADHPEFKVSSWTQSSRYPYTIYLNLPDDFAKTVR